MKRKDKEFNDNDNLIKNNINTVRNKYTINIYHIKIQNKLHCKYYIYL